MTRKLKFGYENTMCLFVCFQDELRRNADKKQEVVLVKDDSSKPVSHPGPQGGEPHHHAGDPERRRRGAGLSTHTLLRDAGEVYRK